MDYAGTGDAHVDHAVASSPTPWNAPAIKGLSSTALQKTTSLAQPKPAWPAVSSASLLDDAADDAHGVHVDAGLGGTHVDRGADILRAGQSLWDGGDELPVGGGERPSEPGRRSRR